MAARPTKGYWESPSWMPARPRLRLRSPLFSWVTVALAVYVATWLAHGVGAEAAHGVPAGWRRLLQGESAAPAGPA